MTDKAKIKILNKHRSPVTCPGCKKEISEDEDLSNVEYVRTRRATDVFFHRECFERIWA